MPVERSVPVQWGVEETFDLAVIGAGAAGLMASITAARQGAGRVIALDGAARLGAKILVAGGGRCNVTHHAVDETAYAGSSRHAIRKVLGRFGVERTIEFFRGLGVELKREETGKLFPTSDEARTVLDALLGAARGAGVEIRHPWRVESVARDAEGFLITSTHGQRLRARRVVLATGGMSLPKTGSDGHGYAIARALGHSITPRVFPALVPLTLPPEHFVRALSGLSVPATLRLLAPSGKPLAEFTNSVLCTHVGLSGPGVLDMSRYWTQARHETPDAVLVINWLAGTKPEDLDRLLVSARGSGIARWLGEQAPIAAAVPGHGTLGLPERLARALCEQAKVDGSVLVNALTREQRAAIVRTVTATELPVTGDRGFLHAEVTAGGVPLGELRLDSMESRPCPGLFLCGEICDVDGRIGGFNFQWAWASGFTAGGGAAGSLKDQAQSP